MKNIREVNAAAALALLKKGALLVDVREPREVAKKAFDVPDVVVVPLSQFQARFREIPSKRQLVVACRSGNRSGMAIRLLTSQGYNKIANLQHGIIGWERAGLPVKGKPRQSLMSRLLQLFGKKS